MGINFTSAWNLTMQSARLHWQSSSNIQSHALALLVIYFIFHYPWGYQNRDKLLKPARKHSKRKLSSSSSSITTSESSQTSLEALDNYEEGSDALSRACPSATAAERKRFLAARQGDPKKAAKMLQNYLQWHQKHLNIGVKHKIDRPDTGDKDLDMWKEACLVAMRACCETGDGPLPRVIRTHTQRNDPDSSLVNKDGCRIFQIMPALMDMKLAKSSTYALAVSLYLNLQLDREGEERIVVCMDVRAGKGWPNTHAVRLVPFMQQTTTLLLSLFPERLHRCLLYPVPSSFMWVWNAISKVVDPLTREKICLISGPNKIASPPPFEKLYDHMDKEAAHQLEDARLGEFK